MTFFASKMNWRLYCSCSTEFQYEKERVTVNSQNANMQNGRRIRILADGRSAASTISDGNDLKKLQSVL